MSLSGNWYNPEITPRSENPSKQSASVFILSVPPMPGSVTVFVNGLLQHPVIDYTLAGQVVTFTNQPASDAWVWAQYMG